MTELDVEALKRSVVRSGATAVLVNDSDWNVIIAALEDRDRLRAAAQKSLDEAVERADIATKGENTKGALEVAVVGLWIIRDGLRAALEGRDDSIR